MTRLVELLDGYQATQSLYVGAKLGIADQLAQGPHSADTLAKAIGVEPGACNRLLRALEHLGVVHEPSVGQFALTPLGDGLRSNTPGGVHDLALLTGDLFYAWWGGLEHSIRTGESSVPGIDGASSFEVLHGQPEQAQRFNRLMSAMVGTMAKSVVATYDFSGLGTIVDIGGGRGTLLSAILHANPHARGILFDLPATIEDARAAVAAAGLSERCFCVSGDFFAGVPSGDCLMLSAVISDWDDEKSIAIFESCRRALSPGGRLLLLERMLEPDRPAPRSSLMDLQMLVIGGGTGRSREEYRRILAAAGFELARVIPTGTERSIFEARPAAS